MTGSLMRLVGKVNPTCFLTIRAPCTVHGARTTASGDGRDDGDLGAFRHGGFGAVFEADVFAVHEHVDEAPDLAVFIANALFHAGIVLFQVSQDLIHGLSGDIDHSLLFSEFSQRGGDAYFGWHWNPPKACR